MTKTSSSKFISIIIYQLNDVVFHLRREDIRWTDKQKTTE